MRHQPSPAYWFARLRALDRLRVRRFLSGELARGAGFGLASQPKSRVSSPCAFDQRGGAFFKQFHADRAAKFARAIGIALIGNLDDGLAVQA